MRFLHKIKDNIVFGNGLGVKVIVYFLLLSFVLSYLLSYLFINLYLKTPEMESFFNKIGTIRIQNGEITEPKNTFIQEKFPGTNNFLFTLNTEENKQPNLDFYAGIYLTNSIMYLKNKDVVTSYPLKDMPKGEEAVINKEIFVTTLKQAGLILSVLVNLWALVFGYIFCALLTKLFLWAFMKTRPIKLCFRAAAWVWGFLWIFIIPVTLLVGIFITPFGWLLIGAGITAFIISKLPEISPLMQDTLADMKNYIESGTIPDFTEISKKNFVEKSKETIKEIPETKHEQKTTKKKDNKG